MNQICVNVEKVIEKIAFFIDEDHLILSYFTDEVTSVSNDESTLGSIIVSWNLFYIFRRCIESH